MKKFKLPNEFQRIMKYPYQSILAAGFAMLLTIAALCVSIAFSFSRIETFEQHSIPLQQLEADIRYHDVVLTENAVMFAITGDQKWETQYKQSVGLLDEKLEAVSSLVDEKDVHVHNAIAALKKANTGLLAAEMHAMELTRQGKGAEALSLLQASKYLNDKQHYSQAINSIRAVINENIYQIHKVEKQAMRAALLIAAFIALLLLPVAVYFLIHSLSKWKSLIEKSTFRILQNEQELNQINLALIDSLEESSRQRADLEVLNEMGRLLHSCISADEAFRVLELYCERLFPTCGGALYRLNSSHNMMEEVARWANPVCTKPAFAPADCRAISAGGPQLIHSQSVAACDHVISSKDNTSSYLCIPLVAQNTTIGLFYMEVLTPGNNTSIKEADPNYIFANAVAEHAALALANINLRHKLHLESLRSYSSG